MNSNNQQVEVDNLPNLILSKFNVGLNTQRFFLDAFKTDLVRRSVFYYTFGNETVSTEIVGFNFHKHCVTHGTWVFGNTYSPTDVFLFSSAMEAVAFAQVSKMKFDFDRCLFIALGVKPIKEQILKIKSDYILSKPKYHSIFGNDLLSYVYDCKISLWLDNKDCKFHLQNDVIKITSSAINMRFKSVEIDRNKFTYAQFVLKFGKKVNLRIHKPTGNHNTFLDLLKSKAIL
jgi:hypothetical protein